MTFLCMSVRCLKDILACCRMPWGIVRILRYAPDSISVLSTALAGPLHHTLHHKARTPNCQERNKLQGNSQPQALKSGTHRPQFPQNPSHPTLQTVKERHGLSGRRLIDINQAYSQGSCPCKTERAYAIL